MQVTYKMTGTRPLLMHNGRLVDKFDPHTRALKAATSKKKRTDEEDWEIGRLEMVGGMYFDETGPIVPGANIEAALRDGAKFRKLGKRMQQGVMVVEFDVPLDYDGPRDVEELSRDDRFIYRAPVKVGMSRLVRTRAKFPIGWSLEFTLQINENHVDVGDVDLAFEDAGQFIGLGDWRPRFGRFTVERV